MKNRDEAIRSDKAAIKDTDIYEIIESHWKKHLSGEEEAQPKAHVNPDEREV